MKLIKVEEVGTDSYKGWLLFNGTWNNPINWDLYAIRKGELNSSELVLERIKEYYISACKSKMLQFEFKFTLKNELVLLCNYLGLEKEKVYLELCKIQDEYLK